MRDRGGSWPLASMADGPLSAKQFSLRNFLVPVCAVQFGTNHLGHFALVQQLLPILKATGKKSRDPARVVVLSSAAHFRPYPAAKGGPVRLDNMSSPEGYDPQQAYVGISARGVRSSLGCQAAEKAHMDALGVHSIRRVTQRVWHTACEPASQ